MQRRNLRKAMHSLVAVCAVIGSLAMCACGDGGGDTRQVAVPVPANANTVQAVQGQALTIPNGSVFSGAIGNNPVTLTFNTPTTFTLTRPGGATATGTVAFDSCSFTVTGPAAGGLIPVGTSITFPTCNLVINGTADVGGAQVQGTTSLVLVNTAGVRTDSSATPVTVTMFIADTGELFVLHPATGALIDTNINTNTSPFAVQKVQKLNF